MAGPIEWNWIEPGRIRRLRTVGDHIFWCYAMLTVTRQIMACNEAGSPSPFPGGRTKGANVVMSHYLDGRKTISTLDRDDALAQGGIAVCAHCGLVAQSWHWDHLIPKSRLGGDYVALNQVRSCPRCNTRRRDLDLMHWHRRNSTFPSLAVLRRYLKLCHFYSLRHDLLSTDTEVALQAGLPFDPGALPRRFPPLDLLVWDYAYPLRSGERRAGARRVGP